MKKVVFFLLILTFTLGGLAAVNFHTYNILNKNNISKVTPAIPVKTTGAAAVAGIKTKSQPGIPVKLQIPAINVDAAIEPVGLDEQKRMDVPKNSDNAGWFDLGYKPGEKGNAALAGHLDKVTGAPAVFWNLSQLKQGDKIIIYDSKNRQYTFNVSQISTYPYNNFPLHEVFGGSDQARLNLITCNGTWDGNTQNYSQRIVVYSQLAK